MRITIIPQDRLVTIDEISYQLEECPAPDHVHALQWYEDHGEIEWSGPLSRNEEIEVLPDWVEECIKLFDELHAIWVRDNETQTTVPDIRWNNYLRDLYPIMSITYARKIQEANLPNISFSIYQRYDGAPLAVDSNLMHGLDGMASFKEAMKLAKKYGIPIVSKPYPLIEETYPDFKKFLESVGMIVEEELDSEGLEHRVCYTPWTLEYMIGRAKTQVTDEMKTNLEYNVFDYNGIKIQCDANSQTNINNKVTQLLVDESVQSVNWRVLDDSIVEFTRDEFIDMAKKMVGHVEAIYQEAWDLKDQIDKVTSEEQLRQLWPYQ